MKSRRNAEMKTVDETEMKTNWEKLRLRDGGELEPEV